MLVSAFIWLALSAVAAATYNVFLKKSPEKLLFSFWVIVFTCFSITVTFCGKLLVQGTSFQTITQRIFFLATEDLLNYFIVGIVVVLSLALKAHLFERYSLTKIIPILEIGTPLTALLYFLLGDSLSTTEILGIGLISCGACISGFERFQFPNIFKPLLSLPFYLYLGALGAALLDTSENLIVYLSTETNEITRLFINFFHTHGLTHFTDKVVTSFEYFQISSLFFVVTFFLYLILIARKSCSTILKELTLQKNGILCAALANFLAQYLYYYIYQNNDQAVVVALTKFSVPLTLALAYFMLKEKIHTPELVAVVLIFAGGIIGAF
jgi:uncharacterized membrane protein